MDCTLCTINVRGLGNKTKRMQIFQWLKEKNYMFYLLQETHFHNKNKEQWEKEWGGLCYFSGSSTNSEGVGILVNPNFPASDIIKYEVLLGRILAIELSINSKTFIIINIYGPNTDDVNIFKILENFLHIHSDTRYIIGGDFNTIIDVNLDKKNGNINKHNRCRKYIIDVMSTFNLIDIWRLKHPDKKQFTWHSSTKPSIHCRLDYFLISDMLQNYIIDCNINASFKTDHSLVLLKFNTQENKRGPGYFKINNSLLFNQEYKQLIKDTIENTVNINNEANPVTLWAIIKGNIRNTTIAFASNLKKKTNIKEKEIITNIDNLEKKIPLEHDHSNISEQIMALKSELNEIILKRVNGSILRSKAIHIENNEKNTAYFSNLEKRNAEMKTMNKLRVNNKLVTGQKDILNEQHKYYNKLYKKNENIETDMSMLNYTNTKLNNEQIGSCEGILTEHECHKAIHEMKNNKSPGSDGLSVEFYKTFWDNIKHYYLKSINESFRTGHLSDLQKQGIISLIPKPGKDSELISNWRPISLLNVDYKIATKAIANRIKNILPSIISPYQTGFIKNRYIGENVRLVAECISHFKKTNTPGLIFFADFEKAFDSLDHNFMISCLRHFNFGQDLINWVKLFYNDIKSIITSNGYFSEEINIERGVRQGCPLSSYLFIICIDILSNAIQNQNDIIGLTINNIEIKQSLFADDATYVNNGTEKSFSTLINTIENFGRISGLKLNSNKSIILRVGTLAKSSLTYFPDKKFIWTSTNAKTLGITFTNNEKELLELNFLPKLQHFRNCLKSWNHRKLTLLGKVTVIKTFALPKIIYPLTVLQTPPKNILDEINKDIYKFIWNNKPEKIKRTCITEKYETGGLNLPDIYKLTLSIKSSWVKRILDHTYKGQYKQFYNILLNKFGGDLVFECNLNEKLIKKICCNNPFLLDILSSWTEINQYTPKPPTSKIIIWNNKSIKNNCNTFYINEWYEKGIKYLQHIFDYRTKQFYSFENIKYLYDINTNDYLTYFQLLSCIPHEIKNKMNLETPENTTANTLKHKIMSSKTKPNKLLYSIQQKGEMNQHLQEKWIKHLHLNSINDIPWKSVYTKYIASTNDISLRSFQYKYINRIIPTNTFLYKCKLTQSNLCDFCQENIETQEHLFWECKISQDLWSQLMNLINQNITPLVLDLKIISLGYNDKSQHSNIVNFLILVMKFFISNMKNRGIIPTFAFFLNYIRLRETIERETALVYNRIHIHQKKWNLLNNYLNL